MPKGGFEPPRAFAHWSLKPKIDLRVPSCTIVYPHYYRKTYRAPLGTFGFYRGRTSQLRHNSVTLKKFYLRNRLGKKEMEMVLRLRDEFSKTLKKSGSNLKQYERENQKVWGNIKQYFSGAGGVLLSYFGARELLRMSKYVLEVSDEVERLQMRLVGLRGSTEGAGQAFEYFRKIAASVPYSLGAFSNAGVTIEAFGAESEKALKAVTDLATFMGGSLLLPRSARCLPRIAR